jgi:nicotinate-nucleotide adenylyltransferase
MHAHEPSSASLGILGGSFNPPHAGHVALAEHALGALGLTEVALMPTHTSPNKPAPSDDPGPEHRLAMCRLAVAGREHLCVSELEIERGGVSYTVDTLEAIHASHRAAKVTLLMGADTALTLPAWRRSAGVQELAEIAVAMRGPSGQEQVRAALGPSARRVRFLEMGLVDVSSSAIRERVAAGELDSLTDVLPGAVAAYIERHGLYRESAT